MGKHRWVKSSGLSHEEWQVLLARSTRLATEKESAANAAKAAAKEAWFNENFEWIDGVLHFKVVGDYMDDETKAELKAIASALNNEEAAEIRAATGISVYAKNDGDWGISHTGAISFKEAETKLDKYLKDKVIDANTNNLIRQIKDMFCLPEDCPWYVVALYAGTLKPETVEHKTYARGGYYHNQAEPDTVKFNRAMRWFGK
jgi:hypothetical protein